jgi:hypothetical protein
MDAAALRECVTTIHRKLGSRTPTDFPVSVAR